MGNYNILFGYIIMIYFFHNSCIVSFEFRNVVKLTIGSYVSVRSSRYEARGKLESTLEARVARVAREARVARS